MKQNKYKGQLRRWFIEIAIFVVAIFAIFLGINKFLLRPAGSELSNKDWQSALTQKKLNYVAIGDSLTEGVGDQTVQGGFVPLLARSIGDKYDVNVISQNFGVSGNTSTQIYARMTKQATKQTDTLDGEYSLKTVQKAIKKADLITLTVGGNDVMKVIRTNLDNLSEKSFVKPAKTYQKEITAIFDKIRAVNPDVPVYVIGIYNPFYLNFPDITQMQDVINNWNDATKASVEAQDKMYFVPVNDLLYQGISGSQGITSNDGDSTTITNDALFEEDHFHPNNIGYQIISDAVFDAYKEHTNEK
ncbi:SGNH/GDSL hydrolase family protein [Pseudolactococcus insecticola]|uniref:Lipase n=1 Tax=Pseudolactococcus insecticola TaxID=2709158 RepID=A0A6A0B437_9LACT|nr:SGNH/GDSL hydrolase family protein [Lactococcus insecticola]GFH40109.1 lipase [Lactococcus insecticola]